MEGQLSTHLMITIFCDLILTNVGKVLFQNAATLLSSKFCFNDAAGENFRIYDLFKDDFFLFSKC